MTPAVPSWISAVGIVMGLIGLLGVAFAVFTSARVGRTLELYEAENSAQGRRIASLEDEDRRKSERLAALEKENSVLRDLATGKTILEKLVEDVRESEKLRLSEHKQMVELLAEIKDALAEMWQGMVRFFGQTR